MCNFERASARLADCREAVNVKRMLYFWRLFFKFKGKTRQPEFPPFELGCCDATADTTVHLLPCLTSFQGGADKKGSPKRCEMVAAGTAAG